MLTYAQKLVRTICHEHYQESCILLMLLTLLVTIACLIVAILAL
ncbi:hypothetical protein SAMN06269173_1332 [Hymenobacter mucosus]|uniref:Uncharacterized protein n=1 Tax=Hymenobacter mucosus TaxID=1411120 RepID=A0A239BKT2_9BACT|nr:hypothetical protein SAMN06269173_1332 [Hymenobacter mucosus]